MLVADAVRKWLSSGMTGATAIGALAALWACGGRDEGDARPSASSAASASAATAVSSAAPRGSASTAPPAEASRSPLAGSWSGTYRSERLAPTLAPTVKDRAWSKDDGSVGSGEGKLELVVSPLGGVEGEVEGPLGPARLVGRAEGDHLFANVVPRGDETSAFSGVVEATRKGDSLELVLRAADGAATTVREAKATLTRAKSDR